MKFDIASEILKTGHIPSGQKSGVKQDKGFGKILEENMNTSATAKTAVNKAPELYGIREMQMAPFPFMNRTPVYEGMEQLLDKLAAYQQKLGDTQVSLDEVAPLLRDISRQSKQLTDKAGLLAEGDPLREIANQALVVSSLEVMKYNRGDYSA